MHHRIVVITLATVELFQLIFGIARMLAGETRQLWRTQPFGSVTAGTGGQAGKLIATACQI